MWNFLYAIKCSNVIEGINTWGETSVEAEYLVVDEGSEGEEVEKVGEIFPHVCIAIFAKALVVKAIDLSDLARFVVASKDRNALRISDFQCNKKSDSLNRVVTSIDIVAWFSSLALLSEVMHKLIIPMKR
jgi:hypothetical protein